MVSDAADEVYSDVLRPGWELEVRLARDEANAVTDAAEYGIHAAGTAISYAAQAGSRVYHAVTKIAEAAGRAAVHVVKTAYHAAAAAATATVTFVKRHAAVITSIVVGVDVFAGCEALTLGIGSIGCALMAGATGALIGAASAGLLERVSAVAGGLLGSGAEAGASSMAEGAADEAASQSSDEAAETAGQDAARSGENDPSCGGESFTAKTRVLLADGKKQAISTLKTGQKVLATNTKTGKNKAGTITAVLVHHDHDLYDLKVRAGGRTAVIDTTRNHLFWDSGSRRWIKAAALKYGTHLRTPSGGQAVALGGHTPQNQSGWMWDLTITPSHDFYITAATADVLAHNDNGDGCGSGALEPYEVGRYNDLQARSEVGDQLDIHHVPQGQPAGQVVSGYVYNEGPAIALPAEEHALIPNLRGVFSGTAEELLARDVGNLRNFTNAPDSSIESLIGLIRRTFPGTYGGR